MKQKAMLSKIQKDPDYLAPSYDSASEHWQQHQHESVWPWPSSSGPAEPASSTVYFCRQSG